MILILDNGRISDFIPTSEESYQNYYMIEMFLFGFDN
jgi:hypothetical protein